MLGQFAKSVSENDFQNVSVIFDIFPAASSPDGYRNVGRTVYLIVLQVIWQYITY